MIERQRLPTGHTHTLFLYANLYVIDLSEGCQGEKCFSAAFFFLPSLKTCSYPSNDPCRWDTNSNVGRHSWPHRLGGICRGSCGQIRPKLYRVFRQRPTVHSRLSSSVFLVVIYRQDAISGKRGTNVTRQLKSLCWIGSGDSLYNPKGQVLPWQQLALSWAGKAYKQMIAWVKKKKQTTDVRAKYVRKERATQGILAPLPLWKRKTASKLHPRDARRMPHRGHEMTLDQSRLNL